MTSSLDLCPTSVLDLCQHVEQVNIICQVLHGWVIAHYPETSTPLVLDEFYLLK